MSKRSKKFLKVVNKRHPNYLFLLCGKTHFTNDKEIFPKSICGQGRRSGGGAPRKRNIIQFQQAKIKVWAQAWSSKKLNRQKFRHSPRSPQRSKTNSGEMTKPHTYQKRRSPNAYINVRASLYWQLPTLAQQRGRTTIGDWELNERVRDGNVCFLSPIITRVPALPALHSLSFQIFLVCIRVAIRFTHVDNPYLKKAQCLLWTNFRVISNG